MNLDALPLATTDQGKRFVMKALHPADHEIKSAKIPGGIENSTTFCVDEVMTYPTNGEEVTINVMPSLICPMAFVGASSAGVRYSRFENPVFGGNGFVTSSLNTPLNPATMQAITQNARDNIERYAITSTSVTLELVAPALSDQGTITAIQAPLVKDKHLWCKFRKTTASGPPSDVPAGSFGSMAIFGIPTGTAGVDEYNVAQPIPVTFTDPLPNESQALGFSRGYTGEARKGTYIPLRFPDFHFHKVSENIAYYNGQILDPLTSTALETPVMGSMEAYLPNIADVYLSDTSALMSAVPTDLKTKMTLYPHDGNLGIIYVRGLSNAASLRIRVRQTFEIIVDNSSPYYPMVTVPAPPDSTALKMYREVAARLKDAYPASFNDFATLKNSIKAIAGALMPLAKPALSMASGFLPMGGAINTIGQALIDGAQQWAKSGPAMSGPLKKGVEAQAKALSEMNKDIAAQMKQVAKEQRRVTMWNMPKSVKAKRRSRQAPKTTRKLRIVRPGAPATK